MSKPSLCVLAILLTAGVASAQPMPNQCAAGGKCVVRTLKITGDGGLTFADGTTQNTGADTSLGAFGSTPNANGASLSAGVLTLQPADATRPGGITADTQSFGGSKTFSVLTSSGAQIYSNGFYGASDNSAGLQLVGPASNNNNSVGLTFNNGTALTTVGSILASWRNAGTEFGYVLPTGVSSVWTNHPVTGPGKRLGEYTCLTNAAVTLTATKLPTALLSAAGAVAAAPTADGTLMMIDFPTLGVTNSTSGVIGPYTATTPDYRARLTAVVRTGASIANTRIFVGLADADISGDATLAALNGNRVLALRYDTGLGDATWFWVTSNATTAVAGATTVSVAANTTYIFDIDYTRSGGVVFRVNNQTVNTNQVPTATLPTGTAGWGVQSTATTLENVAKDFYIGKIALEQN